MARSASNHPRYQMNVHCIVIPYTRFTRRPNTVAVLWTVLTRNGSRRKRDIETKEHFARPNSYLVVESTWSGWRWPKNTTYTSHGLRGRTFIKWTLVRVSSASMAGWPNPIPFVLLHAMFHLIESWYRYLPTTGRYSRVVALYGIRHCTISNLDQNNCNLFRQYVAHSEHCINYK